MGAVVVIGLALLVGAIWLLFKILQAIGAFFEQLSKSLDEAAVARRQKRYSKGRDKLRPYVRTVIPTDLDSFEKKFERISSDLKQTQKLTHWKAHAPEWTKERFQPLKTPLKDAGYREMCIDEIDDILRPDLEPSTWSYKEFEIISRQCKYPFHFPTTKPEKFSDFETISVDL